MQERGLVYCDSGQCILVPTVCRNVSRITRAGVSPDHAEAPAPGIVGGVGPNEAGPSFAASNRARRSSSKEMPPRISTSSAMAQ